MGRNPLSLNNEQKKKESKFDEKLNMFYHLVLRDNIY